VTSQRAEIWAVPTWARGRSRGRVPGRRDSFPGCGAKPVGADARTLTQALLSRPHRPPSARRRLRARGRTIGRQPPRGCHSRVPAQTAERFIEHPPEHEAGGFGRSARSWVVSGMGAARLGCRPESGRGGLDDGHLIGRLGDRPSSLPQRTSSSGNSSPMVPSRPIRRPWTARTPCQSCL
jgi:hypothetical protein